MDENITKTDEPIELTELFRQPPSAASFGDIITTQAILCMAAALVFVALNTFMPSAAKQTYDEYKAASAENSGSEAVLAFLNSTPRVYD